MRRWFPAALLLLASYSVQAEDERQLIPMPEAMQRMGTGMHCAASEGDLLAATRALAEMTDACTRCHAAYRIR